ncbi:UDP-N-acetylmuramoylalanyl-D-glutamyl-2,6-diaminopimelate--D-alanyl-D-alanine ligase [Mesorhizobium sp. BAC0120]|uniref:UDP-N-acetylmuramoylalanyl-D-glutamyl-2, 6-diaminopimelate--D-alanyl-D-alanine ligase n=1 Tax=Mesorhizobium sp. BAC0120 TaxID=3090670 RepID=UPI00298CF349|nr:UDP-N-acetylmuramoylalanyl-D-glutamyl-2,6-diaminopimelate--D-alanyl-D-alanine ligase [Mesorhizobium sp. BAC0120]MDW6020793.1 UDP-N-acetylmuramoylalanyl-D-glutamyl-2,6-diaminopimelate--D-alanyl-D-alanine ligase [Mesorhizobium sp. BAC0120]
MMHLWSGAALVEATAGRPLGQMPESIGGVSIDTRTLKLGDAFFAIRGDTLDGHDFATAAVAAGAGVLVVAEHKLPALGRLNVPKIVVPDVLKALELAGIAARARSRAKIIAVTGSAGKTSTKEALRHTLSTVGKVHASEKSFNNHWGVPLTLARLPQDADFAVFEIGMNHAGEIRPLSKMVRPHVAVVTLIAAAHLGHFRNLDEIATSKSEIFEGVEKGGAALLNRDDRRWSLLRKLARDAGVERVLGFGEHARANFKLVQCEADAEGSSIVVRIGGRDIEARIGTPGRHSVQNALAVLGAADIAGADVIKVAAALATLVPEAGRGRRHELAVPGGTLCLIDESYNANPASMKAALDLLDAAPVSDAGRRIAVLGDMLELGDHSAKLHAGLAELIRDRHVDLVLLAGPEMKALAERLSGGTPVEYRADVEELKPVLMNSVRAGDTVMIKSSKGVGFSKLVDALTSKFPAQAANAKRA